MKTKQDLYNTLLRNVKVFGFTFLFILTGCSTQDEPASKKSDKPELSDTKITLELDGWKPLTKSRAGTRKANGNKGTVKINPDYVYAYSALGIAMQ